MKLLPTCLAGLMLGFLQWWAPARASTLPQANETIAPQNLRDIQIMEEALKKLVLENGSRLPDNRLQGIYLPGYGILFDIQLSDNFYLATQGLELRKKYQIQAEKPKAASKDNLLSVYVEGRPELSAEDSLRFQERIKNIKTGLWRFYIDFASSARTLKAEDKIRVNVRLGYQPDLLHFSDPNPTYSGRQEIGAVGQVADLQKYRLGALSADALGQKIKIETISGDADKNDLDIFAGIFDAGLQSNPDNTHLVTRRSSHGLYIDGFGAVIITETGTSTGYNLLQALEQYDKAKTIVIGVEKAAQRIEKDNERAMDNTIAEMLELTGQYGHILKCVKDQESIIITVINGNYISGFPTSKHFLQVRKADVEKYRKEELDFNQFKQRASIWKYQDLNR